MTDTREAKGVIRGMLGDMMALSDEGVYAIAVLCEEAKVPVNTYCYWWLTENQPSNLYDNKVKSDRLMTRFLEWVQDQWDTAKVQAMLEVDSFLAAERANMDNPLRLFQKPVRDVSPLVQYLMGLHYKVPSEVEWLRTTAMDQLTVKPWYRYHLGDLAEYLPKEGSDGIL